MPQKRFKFHCVHCGACCQDPNTLITLSYFDVLRIAEFMEFGVEDLLQIISFYVLEEPVDEERLKQYVLPPARLRSDEDGQLHWMIMGLRKDPSGTCVYYNRDGNRCKIYQIRPMVCRTFPFTFRYARKAAQTLDFKLHTGLTVKAREYCVGLKDPGAPRVKIRELNKIGTATIEQYLKHQVFTRDWNAAVARGETAPDVKTYLRRILAMAPETFPV